MSESSVTTGNTRNGHIKQRENGLVKASETPTPLPTSSSYPLPSPPLSPASSSTPPTKSAAVTATAWLSSEQASAYIRPTLPGPNDPPPPILSWDDIKAQITARRLDLFKRNPFDRVRYKAWCRDTLSRYGSMTAYMSAERLHWTPLPTSSPTTGPIFRYNNPNFFIDPADYRILFNDWPYGSLDPTVIHLIVWSKSRIPTDPATGFPTAESKRHIEEFVQQCFVERLRSIGIKAAAEDVLWFKNPPSLQTVAGLEHIHVLLRDPPPSLLEEWTGESGPTPHPGFERHDSLPDLDQTSIDGFLQSR